MAPPLQMCLIASSGCRHLFDSVRISPARQQAQITAVSSRPIETSKSPWPNIPEKADSNVPYKKNASEATVHFNTFSVPVRSSMYHIYSYFSKVKQTYGISSF